MQYDCAVCANGVVMDFKREQTMYNIGEVYGTRESVYAPILEMLGAGAQVAPSALQSRVSIPRSIQSRVDSIGRSPRPCILLQAASPGETEHDVCLMATYTSAQIVDLPQAFRHFSLAVHPNPSALPPFNDHIHSIPEWDLPTQWIIAIDFKTRRMVKGNIGRWRCGLEHYVFGASAVEHLRVRVRKTRAIWQSKCALDPAFASCQLQEVINHEAEHNKKGSRPNSRNSVRSGHSGRSGSRPYPDPLNRQSMNVPTTIPEDEPVVSNDDDEPFRTVSFDRHPRRCASHKEFHIRVFSAWLARFARPRRER
uniref:N/A n=1 Tax=Ganoderma boninense TaxID=34458 RepID=A0A5K1K5S7_9APHY|nr:N/A [Ganoderma boninense]